MVILHLLILLSKDLQYFENLVTCVYKLTIRVLTFVDSQDCHVPDYFIHLQDFLCVVLQLDEFSDLGTDSLLSLVELINLVPDFVQLNGATLYRIFKQVAQLDLTSPVINNIIANQCLNTDFEKLFGRYEKPKIFKLYYSDIVVDMANRLITLFQNSGKCEYNICLYYLLKNNPFDTSFLISYYLQD